MNSSHAFILRAGDPLVFRDGRPFGNEASLTGSAYKWPQPSTLAGAVRSRLGLLRSETQPDYFDKSNAQLWKKREAELLRIQCRSLPLINTSTASGDTWEPLFPAPADAQLRTGTDANHLNLSPPCYSQTQAGQEGVFELEETWLLPLGQPEKPAPGAPHFWKQASFFSWLTRPTAQQIQREQLGVPGPTNEARVHTAIDKATGGVLEGALFDSPGIRLSTRVGQQQVELGIGLWLSGLDNQEAARFAGAIHLGGERRVAMASSLSSCADFPEPTADLKAAWESQRFLRVILCSPGSFGSWAPDWLHAHGAMPSDRTPAMWVQVPGMETCLVRLRSACLPSWAPLSGWDMATRSPKAMRKLTPPGTVYLLELKDPKQSASLARHLWGQPLAPKEQGDGFGLCCVGATNIP